MGDDGVVLCLDANFAWPACVTLESLTATWATDVPLTVHCICDESVTRAQTAALTALAERNGATLRVHRPERDLPQICHPDLSPISNARLLAPDMIDADRLLYLDCDTVVCTDASVLLRPIAGGYPVAAARDAYGPELDAPHMGPPRIPFGRRSGRSPYFNAGVLAVDTRAWRASGVGDRLRELTADPAWAPLLYDQDTLNVVLDGRFELLDPRWNVAPVGLLKQRHGVTVFPGEAYVPAGHQADMEREPWIAHFVTQIKPWAADFGDDPLGARWHAAARAAARSLADAGLPPPPPPRAGVSASTTPPAGEAE